MASKTGHGPGAAYQRDGFGGVWKYVLGHGLKRWLKAKRWAKRRAALMGPNRAAFKNAEAVYAKKVAYLKKHEHPKPSPGNFTIFDGLTVPKWIGQILAEARVSGIWTGKAISGFRTPAYSTQLCENMCGAPQCPGRCAGAASNHACPPDGKGTPYEGAVDVYPDAAGLEAYCRSHNRPLYGAGYALPADYNHFSNTGR